MMLKIYQYYYKNVGKCRTNLLRKPKIKPDITRHKNIGDIEQ